MERSHERLVTANLPRNLSAVNGLTLFEEVLVRQARVLIRDGLTPKVFAYLSLRAFARAAAETSRFRNGKVNNSRVSARTGLSRAVVRKVLRPDFLKSIPLTWAPVDAVMQAWCADRRFKDYNGIPRTLKIVGKKASFQSLAKLYAGDLPYRAILDEMKALGLAVTKQNSVACIPSVVRKRYARMSLRPRTKAIHLRSIVDSSHTKLTRKKNQLTSEP
jgi:Family of unknown function (DUF6502)